jgi:DnaJ-class molecular chaperone
MRKEFVNDLKYETKLREKSLTLEIRPGCLEGTKIIFENCGDQSITRKPADLIFTTRDVPHEKFTRDKCDLHMTHEITLRQALTGFKITLQTLDDRELNFLVTEVVE